MDGVVVDPIDGALVRFDAKRDGSVLLEDLGALRSAVSPGQVPEVPDSVVNSMSISYGSLRIINSTIAATGEFDPVERRLGVHVDEETLRLQFDQGLPIWAAVIFSLGLVAAGGVITGAAQHRREQRRLLEEAAARQRALHAREAERSRIARDIHDGPLQDVHALRLISGGRTGDMVGEEAGRIARELRAIAEGLRPPALGRFGLAAALSAHANRVKERYRTVAVGLNLDEDGVGDDALPDVVRSSLFRIAQESITNAIEHGGATAVHVRLGLPDAPGGDIVLEILDNGKGLPWSDSQPDFSALADDGHFGLVGMHERVTAIGGELALSSDGLDDRGARVRVTLPDVRFPGQGDRKPRRFGLASA